MPKPSYAVSFTIKTTLSHFGHVPIVAASMYGPRGYNTIKYRASYVCLFLTSLHR
jgi:hypothetical protein